MVTQQPRAVGRPRKLDPDKRTCLYRVYLTPLERQLIEHAARIAGADSISDYLRDRALPRMEVASIPA